MNIEFTHQFPVLPVLDVLKAQAYYRDKLGFHIDWAHEDLFGSVSNGSIALFFTKVEKLREQHGLVWNTQDADDVYTAYREKGVTIVQDIATKSWGMREFTIEDLNGHRIRIGHVSQH